jgi:hypothetical protein
MPPEQVPLQQSEGVVQPESPNRMHISHVLVVVSQMPEQHCEPLVQAVALLFGMQHLPLVQAPEQQSALRLQVLPFARQSHVFVLVLQLLLQQSELPVQPVCPVRMQSWHAPRVVSQMWEQHCEPLVQPWSPLRMQVTHMPRSPSQAPVQHCELLVQRFPVVVQHAPLTQAWVLVQVEPVPHLHTPLEQVSPVGAQALVQFPQ